MFCPVSHAAVRAFFKLKSDVMARIKLSPLLSSVSGSCGSMSFANSVAGTVLKSKPSQLKVPTRSRAKAKGIVRDAMKYWHNLSESDKAKWSYIAKLSYTRFRAQAERKLSGYTYFLRYYMIYHNSQLQDYVPFIPSFYLPEFPSLTPYLSVENENFFVSGGRDGDTLAYTTDGVNWTGLGTSVFSQRGLAVCKGVSKWVAGGMGSNTLAWSSDGINWTGLGSSIFSTMCKSIAYNGSVFVAGGKGTNSLAWSSDGVNWTGLGTSVFSESCDAVIYTGNKFLAGGRNANTLAWSSDGINWHGLGASVFTSNCIGFAVSPSLIVATGTGGNSIAYSKDGRKWSGIGTSLFDTQGRCVCFNGRMFLAGGRNNNAMAYSYDGRAWHVHPSPPFPVYTNAIVYNGKYFLATGSGTSTIAKSTDGFAWSYVAGSLSNVYNYDIAGARDLTIYPPRLNRLEFGYNRDLFGIELWARLKMSPPVNPGRYPSGNLLKTLLTPPGEDFNRDHASTYYNVFGTLPMVGDRVLVSSAIFGLDGAALYPALNHDLIVTSL